MLLTADGPEASDGVAGRYVDRVHVACERCSSTPIIPSRN